eukprot:1161948-Pelagomonas_calceolata.AAC.12
MPAPKDGGVLVKRDLCLDCSHSMLLQSNAGCWCDGQMLKARILHPEARPVICIDLIHQLVLCT